jgi:hypothetical protein
MVLLLRILVNQESMKTRLLILCLLSLFACKSTKNSVSNQPSIHMPPTIAQVDDALFQQEQAPLQIDSVKIENEILTIYYTCSVSIEKLDLVASSMLAKSFPPIRNCKLMMLPSSKKGEAGPGMVQFDVRPLSHKFTKDAPTYLQIQGWPEKILFIYSENGRRTHR